MLIPLFLMMAVPLVMGSVGIANLYQLEIQWQQRQIHLDNTAIELGREVRTLLNRLVASENELKILHEQLHRAMVCSAIPATALSCRALLLRLRGIIQAKSLKSLSEAQSSWRFTKNKISKKLWARSEDFRLGMQNTLGVSKGPCSICQLPRFWWVAPSKLKISAWDLTNAARSVGVSFQKETLSNSQWNFRLWGTAFQVHQETF